MEKRLVMTARTIKLGFAFAVLVFASLGLFVSTALASSELFGGATMGPDHVILVSDLSDNPGNVDNDFSGILFDDLNGTPVSSITTLGADYNVTDDDCFGGSPRFSVRVDMDNDGVNTIADKNVFIYFGPHPSFSGCTPNTWVSTGNLLTSPDPRFDATQIGGAFYDTWANVLTLVGTKNILGIAIGVDSGWGFVDQEQTVLIDNAMVNGTTYDFTPSPAAINSSIIKIEANNSGSITSTTTSSASTGGNEAQGSRGGRGGRGGDVEAEAEDGDANGNNGGALAGDGGAGGNASFGGFVKTGTSTSVAVTDNGLNDTDIGIDVGNLINSTLIKVEVDNDNDNCRCNVLDNKTRSRARTGGNDALGSYGGGGGSGGEVEAEADDGDANGNNGGAVAGNGGTGGTGAAGGFVESGVADSFASTTNRANTTRIRLTN